MRNTSKKESNLEGRLLLKKAFLFRKARILYRAGISQMEPFLLHLWIQHLQLNTALQGLHHGVLTAIIWDIEGLIAQIAIAISFYIEMHYGRFK